MARNINVSGETCSIETNKKKITHLSMRQEITLAGWLSTGFLQAVSTTLEQDVLSKESTCQSDPASVTRIKSSNWYFIEKKKSIENVIMKIYKR